MMTTTSSTGNALLDREAADVLGDRICQHAARRAQADCELLIAVGEFDAGRGWGWTDGIKSAAHWLAWTCAMTPGTAREHLRVARALRQMPTVTATFATGHLSYSKVREITRLAGTVNEAELCQLAQYTTASQLARLISSYRAANGSRIRAQDRRQFRLIPHTGDPMTAITGKLPTDEAAIIATALQTARDHNSTPPPATDRNGSGDRDTTPAYTDADALLDICQHYLNTADTTDDSGEDRHLIIIEVAAEQLANADNPKPPEHVADVPAGTSTTGQPASNTKPDNTDDAPTQQVENASAGTLRSQTCTIRGTGPVEPHTALRHTCTGSICGAIIDQHGDIRALGRTRRLVSKRQRRALMLRDQICQYPGCWQTRHLQAHHILSWINGGTTDLDNLILLCRFHHTAVHEGGLTITRDPDAPYQAASTGHTGWQFQLPDGQPIPTTGWKMLTADHLTRTLIQHHDNQPDSTTIRTIGGGEGFHLSNCVQAIFHMTTNQDQQAA